MEALRIAAGRADEHRGAPRQAGARHRQGAGGPGREEVRALQRAERPLGCARRV